MVMIGLGSFLSVKSRRRNFKHINFKVGLTLLAVILISAATFSYLNKDQLNTKINEASPTSRIVMSTSSLPIVKDHIWLGTGLGSFEDIYRLYENADVINSSYVNHAHNDYLEWIVETGVAGGVLLIVFVSWILKIIIKVWRRSQSKNNQAFRQAASLSILAVLIHSIVDYPLRTPTISLLAALCLAFLYFEKSKTEVKQRPARKDMTL